MKKINKVLALLMVFVMIFGFSAVSFAEEVDLTTPEGEIEEEVTEDVGYEKGENRGRGRDKEQQNARKLEKQIARSRYSEEELSQLQEVYKNFNNQKNMRAIPVENIFFKNRDVKFDTPPVIKEGRTLIPVRAITEAMGATVTWNSEEKLVTIVKDDKTIVFDLINNITYVNDVEVPIDVPAGLMNNRTMVPLRFIAENLGLKVIWDEEAQTIEVDEESSEDDDSTNEESEDITDEEVVEDETQEDSELVETEDTL
ncbi:copper amine oxidase N-terminal domain-containing protein [Petrocella sp. FN5]|uniref:copper amine oxidase N-terminal domain-containing protein n=1 Tax=Petrocella sp. FN5 TaxID=3032002 RepID=UPI0023DB39EE|nr:copper amine oxidase N-terminal domain-containing protein [Petrocella sp. FN5]MDF1618691.1 copper amine oxidase N-terminal domain-containing protein [Petrocella sp. FN5]